jgi:anti-sigma factor RsiW
MTCAEPRPLVDAYLDRELDLAASLEMEEHFTRCRTCSEAYEAGRRLRAEIGASVTYFPAPAELRQRLASATRESTRKRRRATPARWLALAAPIAAAALLVVSILPLVRRAGDTSVVDEIVSGHVRSLMATHLTDVPSTDKHTVKPWFDGKLDFAPAVVDLADHGFPLVGGRLDYLGKRPVAALVYGRQRHFINLFTWPDAGPAVEPQADSRHGFQLVHWREHGMSYWAISDLNAAELGEFTALARQRLAPLP